MSMDMNESQDRALTRALDEYSEALRAERPSAELDLRLEAAITSWAAAQRSQRCGVVLCRGSWQLLLWL